MEKINNLTEYKKIGIVHSLVQLIILGVLSGGAIFLLPQALTEITGWILLTLWFGLNFIGLPLIIKFTDKILDTQDTIFNFLTVFKILLTGVLGGFLAFIFNLIDYMFHMYFIETEFSLKDFKYQLLPILLIMGFAIILGEIIRVKRKAHAANKG